MDTGNGEVGRDAHTGDGNERIAQEGLHLTQEDVAKVLLDEAGDFLLTGTFQSETLLF
jgi:hypothetical protein